MAGLVRDPEETRLQPPEDFLQGKSYVQREIPFNFQTTRMQAEEERTDFNSAYSKTTSTQKCCFILSIIGFVWCFHIAGWTGMRDDIFQSYPETSVSSTATSSHFEQIQSELMEWIEQTQSNCSNQRILYYEIMGDGFANIHHFIGHLLLIAVSSNRRLLIEGQFTYFGQCPEHKSEAMDTNWHCVYNPMSHCPNPKRRSLKQRVYGMEDASQRSRIAMYFGDADQVSYKWEQLIWSDGIFHQQWFHSLDNLSIRSHIQWFIWNSLNNQSKEIVDRHPLFQHFASLRSRKQKYIAFHIRKSDNLRPVMRDFRVDGERVYSIQYFMEMMEEHIDVDDEQISTIFVCTDNSDIIEDIEQIYANQSRFDFVYNEKVRRNKQSQSEWTWFLNDLKDQDLWNVIVDIEVMRTADYLFGSATSNVYRLAMELNYATNWVQHQVQRDHGRYLQRIFTVDGVPWYQDP